MASRILPSASSWTADCFFGAKHVLKVFNAVEFKSVISYNCDN
uniref:Uncharacterized protein n=1 Tax=Arundo donax TaxID=35708 RepID=A0A0A9H8U8_ARUDO